MKQEQQGKYKYGMVIDLDQCTGCGTCMVACAVENNVTVRADESDKERSIAWMQLFRITNDEPFPKTEVCSLPRPCMHCHHETPCVSVCPATATQMDYHNGIVSQMYSRCIGCRYCQAACPYHARYFNWHDGYGLAQPFSKGLERALSPDVSVRMRGVVEKCSFCHHRLMQAKNKACHAGRRELKEEEYITACSEACPAGAIVFGDLHNPEHRVSQLARDKRAFRLLERLGTDPKVYYLSSKEWVRRKADNYLSLEEYQRLVRQRG